MSERLFAQFDPIEKNVPLLLNQTFPLRQQHRLFPLFFYPVILFFTSWEQFKPRERAKIRNPESNNSTFCIPKFKFKNLCTWFCAFRLPYSALNSVQF